MSVEAYFKGPLYFNWESIHMSCKINTSLVLHLDDPHQSPVLFQMLFEIGESDHGTAKTLFREAYEPVKPTCAFHLFRQYFARGWGVRFNMSCSHHQVIQLIPDWRSWPQGQLIPSFTISSPSNSSSYEPVKPACTFHLFHRYSARERGVRFNTSFSHHQVIQLRPDFRFGQELEKLAAGPVKPIV
jgi:hypothetical protein